MSCKAKKNKQEKFRSAFICRQIRLRLLPQAQSPYSRGLCRKDFLSAPTATAIAYVLGQDSFHCSDPSHEHLCEATWIFLILFYQGPSYSKGKMGCALSDVEADKHIHHFW